jgi:hypothetical protein
MFTVSMRRKTLLLVLVMILVTPWASAAGQQVESPRSIQAVERAELDFFSRLWNFLRTGNKAGCNIDPSGRCTPQNPPPQTKAGCHIDPSGHCIS